VQVVSHLQVCGFEFCRCETLEGPEQAMVNDMVACFTRRMNMQENADAVFPVEIEVPVDVSDADSNQETGDSSSESDTTLRYSGKRPKTKKAKKSAEQKEAEARKRASDLKERREEAAGGQRWKGWVYLQPSARGASIKVGGSRHLGRAQGQHASTHAADVLYKMFEVDLGEAATTSKKQAKFRLRQREIMIRLIFRKHHQHNKREVKFPFTLSVLSLC